MREQTRRVEEIEENDEDRRQRPDQGLGGRGKALFRDPVRRAQLRDWGWWVLMYVVSMFAIISYGTYLLYPCSMRVC